MSQNCLVLCKRYIDDHMHGTLIVFGPMCFEQPWDADQVEHLQSGTNVNCKYPIQRIDLWRKPTAVLATEARSNSMRAAALNISQLMQAHKQSAAEEAASALGTAVRALVLPLVLHHFLLACAVQCARGVLALILNMQAAGYGCKPCRGTGHCPNIDSDSAPLQLCAHDYELSLYMGMPWLEAAIPVRSLQKHTVSMMLQILSS